MTEELTYEYLSEMFELDEAAGVLRWKFRREDHFKNKDAAKRWNTRYAGTIAGSVAATGYVRVKAGRAAQSVHRIVYALHHRISFDEVPRILDHADGNPSNNRPSNLRPASYRNNAYNRLTHSGKFGGLKGAYFDPRSGNWAARIMSPTGMVSLGIFNTKEEAAAAYIGAAIILHGEFFRDPREATQAAA